MKFFSRTIAALAGLAALTLPALSSGQTPPDGGRGYEQRCAKCHSVERVQGLLAKRSAEGRTEFLDRFLKKHYPPSDAERGAIIAFLSKPAEAPKK